MKKGNKRRGGCGLLLRLNIKDMNSCWLQKVVKLHPLSVREWAVTCNAIFYNLQATVASKSPGATVSIKETKTMESQGQQKDDCEMPNATARDCTSIGEVSIAFVTCYSLIVKKQQQLVILLVC